MNSQCCGLWMCWRILGSRALCTCLRFTSKKSERTVVLWDLFVRGGCVGWNFFGGFCLFGFCLFVLVPPSDDLFRWSRSSVDELSIGLVSEENSILLCPSYCWKLPCEDILVHLWCLSSCFLWCSLYAHGHLFMPLVGLSWVQNSFQKISSKSLWLVSDGSLLYCFCGNWGIWVGEVNLWLLWRAHSQGK